MLTAIITMAVSTLSAQSQAEIQAAFDKIKTKLNATRDTVKIERTLKEKAYKRASVLEVENGVLRDSLRACSSRKVSAPLVADNINADNANLQKKNFDLTQEVAKLKIELDQCVKAKTDPMIKKYVHMTVLVPASEAKKYDKAGTEVSVTGTIVGPPKSKPKK